MRKYLDIVDNVLTRGKWKNNRTGTRTLTVPNAIFSHEMSEGFPLLTTKKMPIKTIAVELEGFIQGITDKKWYQERNCHIWDEWANPKKVKDRLIQYYALQDSIHEYEEKEWLKKEQTEETDLGPIYGYQWRRFNQAYDEDDNGCVQQYDQLKTIIDTLHTNPDDRRMVCSAWNPIQMDRMALPPCHFAWGLVHIEGTLSLYWVQRSCDLMLGVPFNIASYGLLLQLLCTEANMKPGNLTGILADCHIYENQIPGAKEQLSRLPNSLPNISIFLPGSIFNWTHNNFTLNDYNPQERIDFGSVAV